MRKVIAMGETIMDIVFHGDRPTAAIPGGSSFNSIVSVGRSGIPAVFLGEAGNDEVGRRIASFLKDSHVDASYFRLRNDIQSAVSLAFLDEHNDAQYMFYKQPPRSLPDFTFPDIHADDVVQFGSYYAINPYIRQQVKSFLAFAKNHNAILYYDLNYRRTYRDRVQELLPAIHENYRLADIVRGSADDFDVMYGSRDAQEIYEKHIAPYCRLFICTCGADSIVACTPDFSILFPVRSVNAVSTIGAGDNFNAGLIYGLIRHNISQKNLANLSREQWETLLSCGCRFSAHVCESIYNSIDENFGRLLAHELHASLT